MEQVKSSYSSGNFSSFGGGYGGGYGYSAGSGSGGYGSGSYGYSSGSSSGGYGGGSGSSVVQNKKSVVIKMIETKDGKVVSESSEVVED